MSRIPPHAKIGSDDDFCLVVDSWRDVVVKRVEDAGVGCANVSVHRNVKRDSEGEWRGDNVPRICSRSIVASRRGLD